MTPATLRNFALNAEQAQSTAREFNEAIDKLNERTDLQLQELRRQASMIAELKMRIDNLRHEGKDVSIGMLEAVEKTQAKLSEDINRILKRCTHLSSATLSKEEEAWFAELDEQRQSILSDGSGSSLQDRAGMVRIFLSSKA
jgi:methyl-accepting chemotaxis protein